MSTSSYPVKVNTQLDTKLSRWLWLVKWLGGQEPGTGQLVMPSTVEDSGQAAVASVETGRDVPVRTS
jgi:hypothetical protein